MATLEHETLNHEVCYGCSSSNHIIPWSSLLPIISFSSFHPLQHSFIITQNFYFRGNFDLNRSSSSSFFFLPLSFSLMTCNSRFIFDFLPSSCQNKRATWTFIVKECFSKSFCHISISCRVPLNWCLFLLLLPLLLISSSRMGIRTSRHHQPQKGWYNWDQLSSNRFSATQHLLEKILQWVFLFLNLFFLPKVPTCTTIPVETFFSLLITKK